MKKVDGYYALKAVWLSTRCHTVVHRLQIHGQARDLTGNTQSSDSYLQECSPIGGHPSFPNYFLL